MLHMYLCPELTHVKTFLANIPSGNVKQLQAL